MQYPIKTQKIFPSPPLLRQQHSVKARVKNLRDAWHPATLTPASRLHQQAASQPLPLTSRRISHEQGFTYHTAPPPAHSRRAAHFLKPLPIAALAALLATPAAWAACIDGDELTLPGVCYGNGAPSTVTVTSDYNAAYGGISDNSTGAPPGADTTGQAIGNSLTIESGTVIGAFGGIAGGSPTHAEGNTLTVKGTVDYEAIGGRSKDGPAIGNFVFIEGGTVNGVVLGGDATANGEATGNTVTLISGMVNGDVKGGQTSDCTAYDCFSNILAVKGKGFQVGGDVLNFDTLNFDLGTVGANDVVLDVGGTADFSKVSSAKFSFNLADGAALKPGDTITLIKAGSLNLPALPTSVTACGHEFELSTTATALTATVKEPAPTPNPTPTPGPTPYYHSGDSSSPTMGELGLLLSGIALAGAAAPALRRREKQGKKADTRQ